MECEQTKYKVRLKDQQMKFIKEEFLFILAFVVEIVGVSYTSNNLCTPAN